MPTEQRRPISTVDDVILALVGGRLKVALLPRDKPPFEGLPALPGGYVHVNEDHDLTATARRVLHEKTGMGTPYLEQLQTFSGQDRDPRGWSLSVAYFALVRAADLAKRRPQVILLSVDDLPDLAFDHRSIIIAAVARVRNKSSYSTLPAFLLGEEFTLSELRKVYEQVIGAVIPRTSFRRHMEDNGIITPVEGRTQVSSGGHPPAQVYRLAEPTLRAFHRTI